VMNNQACRQSVSVSFSAAIYALNRHAAIPLRQGNIDDRTGSIITVDHSVRVHTGSLAILRKITVLCMSRWKLMHCIHQSLLCGSAPANLIPAARPAAVHKVPLDLGTTGEHVPRLFYAPAFSKGMRGCINA